MIHLRDVGAGWRLGHEDAGEFIVFLCEGVGLLEVFVWEGRVFGSEGGWVVSCGLGVVF